MWRNGKPLTLLVGMQTGVVTLENSMEVPQKIKIRATLWLSNCTTMYLPKEHKNFKSKENIYPSIYSRFSIVAKLRKQNKCPSIKE